MPIIFVTLSDTYAKLVEEQGFEAKTIKIQDYIQNPNRKTYYVSPANSLCFMDGGFDYALSRIVFPNIEKEVKNIVTKINKKNLIGRPYLPIGSSIIIDKGNKSLVVAPTMLLPQNISTTQNAYYATMAILYNILINKKENIDNIDIIFTSLCCGFGKMLENDSILQIIKGFNDYKYYKPTILNEHIIINEPNLYDQPKYYQNTEFLNIKPSDILRC